MAIDAAEEAARQLWPAVHRVYFREGATAAATKITAIQAAVTAGTSGLTVSAELTKLLNVAIAASDASGA